MKIALDYDDVLIPFFPSFFAWYNPQYGTNHSADDNFEFTDLSKAFGHDRFYWADEMNRFHYSGLSAQLDPLDGALDALDVLADDGHSFIIMTSRPSVHREHLEGWVERHIPHHVQEVHMYEGDSNRPTTHQNKGEICAGLGVDLLIDDNHAYVATAIDNDLQGIVFGNNSWTQPIKDVPHASDWSEVVEHVRRINQL